MLISIKDRKRHNDVNTLYSNLLFPIRTYSHGVPFIKANEVAGLLEIGMESMQRKGIFNPLTLRIFAHHTRFSKRAFERMMTLMAFSRRDSQVIGSIDDAFNHTLYRPIKATVLKDEP